MKLNNDYVFKNYLRKGGVSKWLFATGLTFFLVIFWISYPLAFLFDSFDEPLTQVVAEGEEGVSEPTGYGLWIGLWLFCAVISLMVTSIMTIHKLLVLAEIKRVLGYTWGQTMVGLKQYEKEQFSQDHFDELSITSASFVTALTVPFLVGSLSFVGTGSMVMWLYFLTFLGVSMYGLRHRVLDAWTKPPKEKKNEGKQKEKVPTGTQQKREANETVLELLRKLPIAYQLNHFNGKVSLILNELRLFAVNTPQMNLEDHHLLERILTEEIPAILTSYDVLDEGTKKELQQGFSDCLDKIHAQLEELNAGQTYKQKRNAKRVIELLNTRY